MLLQKLKNKVEGREWVQTSETAAASSMKELAVSLSIPFMQTVQVHRPSEHPNHRYEPLPKRCVRMSYNPTVGREQLPISLHFEEFFLY